MCVCIHTYIRTYVRTPGAGIAANLHESWKIARVFGRWIGELGAKLMKAQSPDVQSKEDVPQVLPREMKHRARRRRRALLTNPEVQARPGSAQRAWGKGHDLALAGQMVFCRRCGGHTERRTSKLLAGACAGFKKHVALREGLHPQTRQYLGEVTRLNVL